MSTRSCTASSSTPPTSTSTTHRAAGCCARSSTSARRPTIMVTALTGQRSEAPLHTPLQILESPCARSGGRILDRAAASRCCSRLAGSHKLRNLALFAEVFSAYRVLPEPVARRAAWLIPAMELAIALALPWEALPAVGADGRHRFVDRLRGGHFAQSRARQARTRLRLRRGRQSPLHRAAGWCGEIWCWRSLSRPPRCRGAPAR